MVKRWAAEQEAAIARGDFRDPRLGEIKVGDWHGRVSAVARYRGDDQRPRTLRCGVPTASPSGRSGRWRAVTRLEAQEWVRQAGVDPARPAPGQADVTEDDEDVPLLSAATIDDIVHIMSQLYSAAMREHPAARARQSLRPPRAAEDRAAAGRVLEHEEAEALYAAAEEIGAQWRTLIELGTEVGLRPGEIYGLHGHRVDWLGSQIQVIDVMTRQGLRQWPKSKKSHRVVPVPRRTSCEGMSALMSGRPRDSLVFTAPEGGPVTDGHFRNRVWYPAVAAAGIRRFPPRIMRHTAASWLVQDGVPLYDVQELLGHEDYATTQRYAHLAPGAHSKVIESWKRRRDARLTHETKGGQPLMMRNWPVSWSGWPDLNRRPLRPERSALPSCATPRRPGQTAPGANLRQSSG